MRMLAKVLTVLVTVASSSALAEPIGRIGATLGYQQTDRSAWVFGPSLEVRLHTEFSLRGEAQLELGDFDNPFGSSNILTGKGPHVNHVMFGPVWRPAQYAHHMLAVGVEAGVLVMHSKFAPSEFTDRPAAGLFVQFGRMVGPVSIAAQLRVDLSTTVEMGGPNGTNVTTSSARLNFVFEFPINVR